MSHFLTLRGSTSMILIFIFWSLCFVEVKSTNINKTDDEQRLEDCKQASTNPEYFRHPDMNLRATQIIEKYGYPVEVHHVTTEDGYILELHRIPYSKNSPPGQGPKRPVFIQHGIMASSVNWILPPVENALAYRLADIGFDVFLGNARGSSYSLGHINPKQQHDTFKFWDFSWHEMGKYDLPAVIDYILKETNHQKLTYIGHSMGCTMFFVCMSLRPEYNEKIEMMFALAPVAFVGNATSFFKLFAPFSYNLERLYQVVGGGQLIPEMLRRFLNPLTAASCMSSPMINCHICSNIYFLLFNSDGKQMNHTLLPVIIRHFPDNVSTKTVIHFGQNLVSDTFQQFDPRIAIPTWFRPRFVPKKQPPEKYNLSKITAPVVIFHSERDNLASPKDVARLAQQLPNLKASVKVCYSLFNHNDFLFGIDVNEHVYDKLISILSGNHNVDVNCEKNYSNKGKR